MGTRFGKTAAILSAVAVGIMCLFMGPATAGPPAPAESRSQETTISEFTPLLPGAAGQVPAAEAAPEMVPGREGPASAFQRLAEILWRVARALDLRDLIRTIVLLFGAAEPDTAITAIPVIAVTDGYGDWIEEPWDGTPEPAEAASEDAPKEKPSKPARKNEAANMAARTGGAAIGAHLLGAAGRAFGQAVGSAFGLCELGGQLGEGLGRGLGAFFGSIIGGLFTGGN